MSALHRLKAYFGMVPAEEFDDFDADYPSRYDPGYDPHRAVMERDYAAERPGARRPHRADCGGHPEGIAPQNGHHAAPRMHVTRPPSWAAGSSEPWAGDPWGEAPVRGALAINTAGINPAGINPAGINSAPPTRQPAMSSPVTPPSVASAPSRDPRIDDEAHPLARIVTLHPHNYNEARPIGERYREGNPVIMNLTEMEDRDAKRLVDFAAGLAFALRGSIDKVTNKVFLLSPPDVDVSAEDRRRIAEGRFFN